MAFRMAGSLPLLLLSYLFQNNQEGPVRNARVSGVRLGFARLG